MTNKPRLLSKAYDLRDTDAARALYDRWAEGYDDELRANGYVTPMRCAQALARCASLPWAPMVEFGCGTGLSGLALAEAGFECIDGLDLSQNMLDEAARKNIYRSLTVADLSAPLRIEDGLYQNAAAIGVLNTDYMPATVIDAIVKLLPCGGCFVFSINDHTAQDGQFEARVLDLTENTIADLIFKEHGDHIPGTGLQSTIYVLKKR